MAKEEAKPTYGYLFTVTGVSREVIRQPADERSNPHPATYSMECRKNPDNYSV
jgi:hypothetical protein